MEMARPSGKKSADEVTAPPAIKLTDPAAELDPAALAEGILARTIRPRAADVRKLAGAVLAAGRKPDKKKKKKKTEKKADGKKRKLSKIPGQKAGK